MPDSSTGLLTPGVAEQAIPAGFHDGNGNGRVAGDADLTAVNIRAGSTIFGVMGSVIQATGIATSDQVLDGVTFSNSTGQFTGAMPPSRVGETGQTTCYDAGGAGTNCATGVGIGQDGDLTAGVAWPNPRFTDNTDGTVTDNLTGLIWLQDAHCMAISPAIWTTALTNANTLATGACGLTDSSMAGDWRLPSVNELQSLIY